jgi:hypothetical protein
MKYIPYLLGAVVLVLLLMWAGITPRDIVGWIVTPFAWCFNHALDLALALFGMER